MPRFKFTEQQMELIALLPKPIRQSNDLTNAQKLVLAQIDLQDGTEFSAENHYVFSSNKDLMKNTGIASEHTVINAVKVLLNNGLIETRRGYRRKGEKSMASEYILTDKYYELGGRKNPHAEGCNKDCNKGCNKDCNNNTAIKSLLETIQQEINELRAENEFLRNELQKSYCSTEPDTDIDTDIEVYNRNDNNVYIEKYNKNKLYNTNSMKEEKIKRKEESNTAGQGSLGSEEISIFSSNEVDELHVQGERDRQGLQSNEISNLNSISNEQGSDELDTTPSVRSGMNNNFYTSSSNKRKDSQERINGNSLHPTESDSGEIEISAADLHNCDLGAPDSQDNKVIIQQEKRSQEAPGAILGHKGSITKEIVQGIISKLGDYYADGAKVLEYEPHKYEVRLINPVTWPELTNAAYNYLYSKDKKMASDLCIDTDDDRRFCRVFKIYTLQDYVTYDEIITVTSDPLVRYGVA